MSAPSTAQQVITAAFAIAKQAATASEAGTFDANDLDAELLQQCRDLFGTVVGPQDPLWSLQTDVARAVLASGGLDADEVSEWAAVARRRASESTPEN